jgi:protein-S-isoprenylcysteine O-methyltransferase Ste14
MLVLARALAYATVFVGLVLIYLPASLLPGSALVRPVALGPAQIAGMAIGTAGAALAVACLLAFALIGKGTPAPFDPPRRLVVRGPYRFVRNPMYLGGGLTLAGAALFYGSLPLLGYAAFFFLAAHLFVIGYEEPALRRTFGQEYEDYRRRVGRWWPRFAGPSGPPW